MIIFILIPWFDPAYRAGGPITSIVHMVEQMKNGYSFKIFCSDADLDGKPMPEIQTDQWVKYRDNADVWYAAQKTRTISIVKKEIKKTKADALFINGIYSWPFNLAPLLFTRGPKKILSTLGMLHTGALSQKSFKKKIYLGLLKYFGVSRRCYFHAATEDEKVFIRKVFPKSKVFVIPNFPAVFKAQAIIPKMIGSLEMTSVALISPMKNYLLVLQALETCSENITYHIWGPIKDQEYWRECLAFISKLPTNINVQHNGEIHPSKVEGVLARCHLFILPSKSENFCHAIYEALSCGRPVITSHNTPWNGLEEAHAGLNVAIANELKIKSSIQKFASMDQHELAGWSSGAKQYIEKALDIEEVKQKYIEMFTA